MKTKRLAVQYRRKREGKTDFKTRMKLLLSGMPRAIIRKTLKRMIVQLAENSQNGDKIIISSDSNQLKKYGWKHGLNLSTSYLTGYLAGSKAKDKVKQAVADIGYSTYKKGNVYAALKGIIDGGVSINHDPSIFPPEDRLKGKHLKKEGISKEIEETIKKIQEK